MPRTARIVIPGCPHHVTQRGNNRQDVFFVDDDRRMYLSIFVEDAADLATFRLGAARGRPLGSDSWLSKLERRVGRRLRPRPVGRPRQKAATNRRQCEFTS